MYPYLRTAHILWSESRKPPIGLFETHILQMRCRPGDIDGFAEMNNGRILMLYDLGRFALALRSGLGRQMRAQSWGLVVAGSTVRYRARLTLFQPFALHTRLLGWDARFIYLEQAMWRGETACNHALLRTGVTSGGKLVPTSEVAQAMKWEDGSPDLPPWARAWAEADRSRPWPPEV